MIRIVNLDLERHKNNSNSFEKPTFINIYQITFKFLQKIVKANH